MTLAELADRIGTAPRQIRFLIAEEILPPAHKTGRAADAYGEEHLIKAQRYLALHRMGMKPASIRVLMAFDDAVPIVQSGGVELRVSPDIAPEAIDVDMVVRNITTALKAYVLKGRSMANPMIFGHLLEELTDGVTVFREGVGKPMPLTSTCLDIGIIAGDLPPGRPSVITRVWLVDSRRFRVGQARWCRECIPFRPRIIPLAMLGLSTIRPR